MRRILVGVGLAALLVPAGAAGKTKREVETTPVDIDISSEACPNLPPGTEITGSGTMTSVTWTTTKGGRRTITNTTTAPGTATDQAGNAYTFVYSNQFRIANTKARKKVFKGIMVDLFRLDGAAPLINGFVARYTTDLGDLQRYNMIEEFGNPLDESGSEGCDPL